MATGGRSTTSARMTAARSARESSTIRRSSARVTAAASTCSAAASLPCRRCVLSTPTPPASSATRCRWSSWTHEDQHAHRVRDPLPRDARAIGGLRLPLVERDREAGRALGGPLLEMRCAGSNALEHCDRPQPCGVHEVFQGVYESLNGALGG